MDSDSQELSKWGGKREGSGRKKTGRSTKVIRVPDDLPDSQTLQDIVMTLKNWKCLSDNASKTSARWQRLRELLSEIDDKVFD